jgi:hypothetical protein
MAPMAASFLMPVIGWRATLLTFSVLGPAGVGFLLINESKRPSNWSGVASFKELTNGVRDIFRSRIVVIVIIVEMVMAFRVGISDYLKRRLYNSDADSLSLNPSRIIIPLFNMLPFISALLKVKPNLPSVNIS